MMTTHHGWMNYSPFKVTSLICAEIHSHKFNPIFTIFHKIKEIRMARQEVLQILALSSNCPLCTWFDEVMKPAGLSNQQAVLLTCVLTTMGQLRSHDSWGEWICDKQHTCPQGNLRYLLLRWVRWGDPSELGSVKQKEIRGALWLKDSGADKVHDVHREH
jgi:hypothetical protein